MKLRKIITMGIAAIMAVSAMSVSVFAEETDRDIVMKSMPNTLKQIICNHDAEGKNIIFYADSNERIKSRAVTTVNLPSNGFSTNKAVTANEQWKLNANFFIQQPCDLNVYLTTGDNGDYVECTIKVACVGGTTQTKTVTASPNVTDPFTFDVISGNTYTVTIIPKESASYLSAYVHG